MIFLKIGTFPTNKLNVPKAKVVTIQSYCSVYSAKSHHGESAVQHHTMQEQITLPAFDIGIAIYSGVGAGLFCCSIGWRGVSRRTIVNRTAMEVNI